MPKIDADDLISIGPKASALVQLIVDGGKATSDGGKRYTRTESRAIAKAAGELFWELFGLVF